MQAMRSTRTAAYDDFEDSELFCPRCRCARPVRKHLLIVLPGGNKFDYRCSVCNESIGSKMDDDRSAFDILKPR